MSQTDIIIRGAREHNLRDIDLQLPRNRLIVMTGVSGSGKSSLAFDTLYAEGQRRYVESLSSYARQFLGQMPKPEVDAISGLAPSISIQQKATGRNPRSTVGTITEIYDYLRVLFARVGQGYCYESGLPIRAQSTEQILENILLENSLPQKAGMRYQILAPVVQQQKGEYRDLFADLLKQGFLRARVDGEVVSLTDNLRLDRQMRHNIEVVIDRLAAGKEQRSRLAEAIETALKLGDGKLIVAYEEASSGRGKPQAETRTIEKLYSRQYACPESGISYEPLTPQLFSFNSPLGMCPECNGLGMRHDFILERLLADEKKPIAKGAFHLLGNLRKVGRWKRHIYQGAAAAIEKDLHLPEDSLLNEPWKDLPPEAQRLFLFGTGTRNITFSWRHAGGVWKHGGTYEGFVGKLLEKYRTTGNPMRRRQLEKYMEFVACAACAGTRLNRQARHVRITSATPEFTADGRSAELSLPEVCALSIAEAHQFFQSLALDETQQLVAEEVLKEIRGRLGFLLRCGLDYLTLERTAPTLSGGESQRIRLAGQIGCGLVGVVYILDEPSIGLHPRDNSMLLESLCDLRDQGNTVIVVEHDEETMRAADHIVDFGPGPGVRGGEVVAEGSVEAVMAEPRSITGQYLTGAKQIEVPAERRQQPKQCLKIVGAEHHNLRNIDVEIPLKNFVCVTGVSGSGKSSLINDILWETLNKEINGGKGTPGKHKRINGLGALDKAINIDQSPIGRTPRSNPATYVKVFDHIRKLFTQLPASKLRGYEPGRFSFNVDGGRCSACEGYGSTRLEMDFLADVWVTCPVCGGHRFNHETLEVHYKGKSIADVLEMDIQEALEHFENLPPIRKLLQTLHDVGLDYMKLGQPSPTLSGGEAQRIKLARELGKRSTGSTMYLLDEPTTGLHFADVHKLLEVLHGFVDAGNTVLVVEHNLDVIKTADWIIDLGPEGGAGGGTIVAAGTPEQIAAEPNSHTGQALRELFDGTLAAGTKSPQRRNGTNGTRQTKRANGHSAADTFSPSKEIVVRGAKQHNLQDVDLEIPRDKMSVFCGPSGSGKSSLAMETLYAEGQRRYVESLSAYARQFLGQMPKPKVEHIHGLSPAIAIEQKTVGNTPRSTVGTVTEIYDYLRILFTRLGQLYCPDCEVPVRTQTSDEIIEKILALPEKKQLLLLAPQSVQVGQSYERLWERIRLQGFRRVRIDGVTHSIDEVPDIDRRRKHDVEIIVDRFNVSLEARGRIADSVETALELGQGVALVAQRDTELPEQQWTTQRFSLHFACEKCDRSFEELTPQHFSFNSPLGWCPACEGIGSEQGTNLSSLVANPSLSLRDGAVSAWPVAAKNPLFDDILGALSAEFRIPLDVPFYQLPPGQQRLILYGTGDSWLPLQQHPGLKVQYKGLYPAIEEASRVSYAYRQQLRELNGETVCSACNGGRLHEEAASVRFRDVTLPHLCQLPLDEVLAFLQSTKLNKSQKKIAGDLLDEATNRLTFLVDVGLHYLTLSRIMPSLSGGESQRIRLAGQIGRALTGVLYVLDEPTIGLHPRDNGRLLGALHRLRDIGNTVLLVEHDREVLQAADRLYDFGPGAGRLGGNIVSKGTPKQLSRSGKSLTGRFLSGKQAIPIPATRRIDSVHDNPTPPANAWLELTGAKQNNLRNVDLRIPLGTLTCITGVSGSGKSSLIEETLAKAVGKHLHRSGEVPGPFEKLTGVEHINKVIAVDQQPLGSTPASNPATYTGVFDHIRELFARLPDARVRGYRPGRFSFNRSGGRCDDCEGMGQKKIEMHFLPDVWITCDTCKGKRYNQETLAVKFRGQSIADVLDCSIDQARELFANIPKIRGYLETMSAIGLDYLTLGQSAPTLSGGEAQRVKLASELARPNNGNTLYLLDEPTTGLHFDDIQKLLKVLNSLVEQGNTVVVIEHNLDVIKTADWIVDLGPDAGNEGGWIVAEGTPEDIVAHWRTWRKISAKKAGRNGSRKKRNGQPQQQTLRRSYTGEMLQPVLDEAVKQEREVFRVEETTKKREGDLSLGQIGKEARLPWQTDGRRWHTADRLSHRGVPCKWEGEALARVIDALEAGEGLAPANWNHRSTVEMTAASKKGGWFLHALTAEDWLLKLKIRVKKKTFDQEDLRRRIPLKPLDDLDELPVYGRNARLWVRNLKGPWQEVTVAVHWLDEIDTPEFWQFLDEARESFLEQVNTASLDINELTPWKVLGRKWHLSRKGFPSRKRITWEADVVEELAQLLEETLRDCETDWGNKQVANFTEKSSGRLSATLHTKRREGVDLTLLAEPGRFALGRFAALGADRSLQTARDGREAIKIRFDSVDQVRQKPLTKFLEEFATTIDS